MLTFLILCCADAVMRIEKLGLSPLAPAGNCDRASPPWR